MSRRVMHGYKSGRPNVVVIGGGFGGMSCVQRLSRVDANVLLLDRSNHHLFQPLLYQVATGVLGESDIAYPLRRAFSKQGNVSVLIGEVEEIDLEKREVRGYGRTETWDHLVIAAGMRDNYFGNDQWAEHAPGLKSLHQATDIRNRILTAFEAADHAFELEDHERLEACMTFIVVGGGATGVELAGAIKQLAVDQIAQDFKDLDTSRARVLLVEGSDRILSSMSERSSNAARKTLESIGVEVHEGRRVMEISGKGVMVDKEFIAARTVVWAAGVTGSSLAGMLGVELVHGGRVPVEPDLTLAGRGDVRVIGDLAMIHDPRTGKEVPGVAQGAIQMGAYAGRCIAAELRGRTSPGSHPAFTYFDKGTMATVGRGKAVLESRWFDLSGFPAWIVWALVHIVFLVGFRSRIAAMWGWLWAYLFFNASNEIITRPLARDDGDQNSVRSRSAKA